jgi:hypothetical protein
LVIAPSGEGRQRAGKPGILTSLRKLGKDANATLAPARNTPPAIGARRRQVALALH